MSDSAFSHVALCVPDIEAARAFYCDVFGFEPATDRFGASGPDMDRLSGFEGCDFEGLFMRKNGLFIELTAFKDASGAEAGFRSSPLPHMENEYGFAHFAFRVADVDKTLELVAANGGEALSSTRLNMATPGTDEPTVLVFCLDPYGNRIELIQHPNPEAAAAHSAWMNITNLDWASESLDSATT